MAASQGLVSRIPSRCTTEMAQATFAFEIAGYSRLKGLGGGKSILSPAFSVGGYEWCILCYPAGRKDEGYISVFLTLLTKNAEARALHEWMLVDQISGRSHLLRSSKEPRLFDRKNPSQGIKFLQTTTQIKSGFVWNDSLVIECKVSVIKETFEVHVPRSDLSDNLATLLEGKKGADVTFNVQGEFVSAHKVLLAMRSAVFDAEFYGPMGDKGAQDITIDDMQPAVFKAFLYFIYTDSMPSMDDLDDDDKREMVKHLLVAADKYAMKRMKMICESMLCKSLDVETVATVLALADQHNCSNLKDACVEFMLSSNRMNDVIASQGYLQLKRSSPEIIVDVLERAAKSRKI